MHSFIASPAWDDGLLWTELARTADQLVGGSDACVVIDDKARRDDRTVMNAVGHGRIFDGKGRNPSTACTGSESEPKRDSPAPVHLLLPTAHDQRVRQQC